VGFRAKELLNHADSVMISYTLSADLPIQGAILTVQQKCTEVFMAKNQSIFKCCLIPFSLLHEIYQTKIIKPTSGCSKERRPLISSPLVAFFQGPFLTHSLKRYYK